MQRNTVGNLTLDARFFYIGLLGGEKSLPITLRPS